MPVLFIGHGSPENAFEDNEFGYAWADIASRFPKPVSVLVVSAHWTSRVCEDADQTRVTAALYPETLHDFHGFPKRYFDFVSPIQGNPALAARVKGLVTTVPVRGDASRGFDHGSWSVLSRMYPDAEIPVVELSIDEQLRRKDMIDIGRELATLRDEGVLILGSGNIVHNLGTIEWNGDPYPWATEFDSFVRDALVTKDSEALVGFEKHRQIRLAHPSVDHFLPLLYVIGAAEKEDPVFFCETVFAASLSMRCVAYGL